MSKRFICMRTSVGKPYFNGRIFETYSGAAFFAMCNLEVGMYNFDLEIIRVDEECKEVQ